MKSAKRFVFLAALSVSALLFTGCISTNHYTMADVKTPSRVAAPQSHVAITPEFAKLRDEASVAGHVLWTFPSGEVAAKFFNATSSPWKIECVSSQLVVERRDDFPLPVVHTTARYSISCIARGPSRAVPISATGMAETGVDVPLAIRDAVERAMLSLAKQSEALVE